MSILCGVRAKGRRPVTIPAARGAASVTPTTQRDRKAIATCLSGCATLRLAECERLGLCERRGGGADLDFVHFGLEADEPPARATATTFPRFQFAHSQTPSIVGGKSNKARAKFIEVCLALVRAVAECIGFGCRSRPAPLPRPSPPLRSQPQQHPANSPSPATSSTPSTTLQELSSLFQLASCLP